MTDAATKVWNAIFVALGVVTGVFVILALGALLVLVAWNLGVIGLAAAVGLGVTKIGFWTAFGASALTAIIQHTLHPASVSSARAKQSKS